MGSGGDNKFKRAKQPLTLGAQTICSTHKEGGGLRYKDITKAYTLILKLKIIGGLLIKVIIIVIIARIIFYEPISGGGGFLIRPASKEDWPAL